MHLSSQDVEQIRWTCHISNLHVAVLVLAVKLFWGWELSRILVTELEISLHPARGVLRSLSIVTVR